MPAAAPPTPKAWGAGDLQQVRVRSGSRSFDRAPLVRVHGLLALACCRRPTAALRRRRGRPSPEIASRSEASGAHRSCIPKLYVPGAGSEPHA
eukprot:CAMPEP_0175438192 /NCGR_PEP_ID=MMETSP0095-20121207/55889_1 /TAXON_ID=311494 /ORGANISM="Alexandrium monilatum, Strain CCMP3105" /LENGTH=92 /DNA_ID=CAMNT_0016737949 /DNA_START=53 /DNA_END=328 /DNA_ORIENTATION=+